MTKSRLTKRPKDIRNLLSWIIQNADQDGECLIWRGSKGAWGHSRMRFMGTARTVNNVIVWLRTGGNPNNLYGLHKCDRPSCVNPLHIYAGTQKENARDMVMRGRGNWALGENNGKSKLTAKAAKVILQSDKTRSELAHEFGVSWYAIDDVLNGRTWKHIGSKT